MKNLKAGFSLVELMVVVAIIGILATIAVPNFTKFQAKAKQANAKSELSGLYTAQKAFFTEYNTYHSNLPYVGYVPDGLGADANNCPTAPAAGAGVIRYYRVGFISGVTAAQGGAAIQCGAAAGAGTAYVSFYPERGTSRAVVALAAGATTDLTTFLARANGIISNSAREDRWTIDQTKSMLNTQQGL